MAFSVCKGSFFVFDYIGLRGEISKRLQSSNVNYVKAELRKFDDIVTLLHESNCCYIKHRLSFCCVLYYTRSKLSSL
jgi:hypothetical protein